VPVVKFFNPIGAGTWLTTEMEPDGDAVRCRLELHYPLRHELSPIDAGDGVAVRLRRDKHASFGDRRRQPRTLRAVKQITQVHDGVEVIGNRSPAHPRIIGCSNKRVK
jgi:hypothetical protein